jgi:hypothetical protein
MVEDQQQPQQLIPFYSSAPNRFTTFADDSVTTIFLEQRRANGKPAPVVCVEINSADYDLVKAFRWELHEVARKNGSVKRYARSHYRKPDGSRGVIKLHQILLPDAGEVLFLDGNSLNNTRANLKAATRSDVRANARNKRGACGFRGVSFDKTKKTYRATIKIDGKRIRLGSSKDPATAARLFDEAIRKYGQPLSKLNFAEVAS